MSIELGRRLIAAGVVRPSEVEAGFSRQLMAAIPFVRALLELGHLTEEVLERELASSGTPLLSTIVPLAALVDELPNQMCRRFMAIPVRRDQRTGLIDVAVADPFDAHIAHEFSYHLKSEVRILRGSVVAIAQALARMDRGEYSASVILRKSVRPPGYAAPSVPPLRSDRPIPLVRKVKRGRAVEVHPIRNVTGVPRDEGRAPADLSSPQVSAAPSMPTFAGNRAAPGMRQRQQTAPGPPDVPPRREPPPVPPSVRGRSASGSPASARRRPEVPAAVIGRIEKSAGPPAPPKAPVVSSGAPPGNAARVPTPATAGTGAKGRPAPGSPPPTTRGHRSPKAPPANSADIRAVLSAMRSAATRDDVIDGLIVGMSTVARRVGVFSVKKARYRGVACNTELGDPARFRTIEISSEVATVLGIAATSGSYLGPLPVTKSHEELLAFMKNVASEVAVSLIRVAGRPAVILFADGLGDTLIATRRAEELGHEASLAFSRILTDAKADRGRG